MIIYMHIFICVVPTVVPVGLRYTALQSRSITLHWEQLPIAERGGPHNTYKVEVHGCRGSEQTVTDTHVTIRSLRPYSICNISVKACTNIDMCGPFSPYIQIQTLEDGM